MNCVIFGFGYMGKIRYRVLRQHPDVREIKVVDPGVDPVAAGLEGVLIRPEAVDWPRADAAFICTPNNVTAGLCADALLRCRHVFCEKPPGRNWEEFTGIVDAAVRVPRHTLMFGFNHRFHPAIQAARSFLGEGGLGEVLYLKGTYGKSGGLNFRQNWRSNPVVAGGGILLDQGIHMLDLLDYFLGPLEVVQAVLVDAFWDAGLEDNAFVLLRSPRNIPAFVHSSATLWKHTFRIEIGCRDGYLIISGLLSQTGSYGREQLIVGRRQFEDEAMALGNPREEIIYFDRDESWEQEVAEFLDAVKADRPASHGTLDDAQRVMAVIRDVYALAVPRPVRSDRL